MDKCDRIKVYIFLFMYTLLFIGEFLINQVTHSVLILVDSYYNLFQVCMLIFILINDKTSQTQRTSIRATFGWARCHVLGTLICHTFFGALVFALIVESLQLIVHTTHESITLNPNYSLFASIVSLTVQLCSCRLMMELLNKESNSFSINGPNVQMHFVVRSQGDELENIVTVWENYVINDQQQTNQIVPNNDQTYQNNNNNNKTNHKLNSLNSINGSNEKRDSKMNASLDGSQLKKLKQNEISQRHLTLRIFRNFISSTFLIVNSIIGCILLKSKHIELETIENALKILDPISAIISVILLSILVYPEIKQSGLILLQSLPSYIDIDKLKRKLTKRFPMIFEIHEFHCWQLNTERTIATCHIKLRHHFRSTEQFGKFLNDLQLFFKSEGIDQATIQPEFICINSLKSNNNSSCTLNDENENALLQRVPSSCLLKCNNLSSECEQNSCCHPKKQSIQCDEKIANL